MPIKQSFTDNPAYKTEIVQVIWVYETLIVGVVCNTIRCQLEKTIVRVEHRPRQLDEEVSSQTASVYTCLTHEVDMQTSFKITRWFLAKLCVRLRENLFSSDLDTGRVPMKSFFFHFVNLFPEESSLVLKIQQIWHRLDEGAQRKGV